MGIILGGGAVFLLGTRTGKNLLKIISEQGLDGLVNLLEEYDLEGFEEIDDMEEVPEQSFDSAQDLGKPRDSETKEESSSAEASDGQEKKSPKHRFFRRIRK